MNEKPFGGPWSETKLECIEDYLAQWLLVMKKQSFRRRYVDAFSGSGHFEPKAGSDAATHDTEAGRAIMEGSAIRALRLASDFDHLDFIEIEPAKAERLNERIANERINRAKVHQGDVNVIVPEICASIGSKERAVAFLDPYGAQVNWSTVQAIARTEKIDLWYLLPVSIVNRMISEKDHSSKAGWERRLTNCLGTDEWKEKFFVPDTTPDLFGEERMVRDAGTRKVESYFVERLRTIFPTVLGRCLRLITPNNTHLFSLCFAVSNPEPRAIGAASRIAGHLIDRAGLQT